MQVAPFSTGGGLTPGPFGCGSRPPGLGRPSSSPPGSSVSGSRAPPADLAALAAALGSRSAEPPQPRDGTSGKASDSASNEQGNTIERRMGGPPTGIVSAKSPDPAGRITKNLLCRIARICNVVLDAPAPKGNPDHHAPR